MNIRRGLRELAAGVAALGAVLLPWGAASAYDFETLHTFCASGSCTDGENPIDLIADAAGNLYGETWSGGDVGLGVVFELVPNAKKTKWRYKRLWAFCAEKNCADGEGPSGGLIIDVAGNLYGTTSFGGKCSGGTVFRLSPAGKKWKLKVLHDFCSGSSCTDTPPDFKFAYAGSASGAPYDGTSALYTVYPQTNDGQGSVVSLTPAAEGEWTSATIYNFCAAKDCRDGSDPEGPLTADAAGNLYGTTNSGGDNGGGTVFELTPGSPWKEKVIHSFCTSCVGGSAPFGPLFVDAAGTFYGATRHGGSGNGGVAYKLDVLRKPHKETVLYSFCPNTDCTVSGWVPFGGVTVDSMGNIFTAPSWGGAQAGGTVLQIGPDYDLLYTFCGEVFCSSSGFQPMRLFPDSAGNLYGITYFVGESDDGTVFELRR